MTDAFTVRVTARGYEADANGHVAGAVLLLYGQHARWECLRSAGIDHAGLRARGIGPVSLEERIRFHAEVMPGDELEVTPGPSPGGGLAFRCHLARRPRSLTDLMKGEQQHGDRWSWRRFGACL